MFSILVKRFINDKNIGCVMFGLFGSKGVTHLRSVLTDYQLVNQVYQKLKSINDSEIRLRKFNRDGEVDKIIIEVQAQVKILDNIDKVTKVKTLRLGELARAQEDKIKKQIKQLGEQMKKQDKEFGRHLRNMSKGNQAGYVDAVKRQQLESKKKTQLRIKQLTNLQKEYEKVRAEIRTGCKASMKDYGRLFYNV